MKINKLPQENLKDSIIYNCIEDYKMISSNAGIVLFKEEKYTHAFLEKNIQSFSYLFQCTNLKNYLEQVNNKFILQNLNEEQKQEQEKINNIIDTNIDNLTLVKEEQNENYVAIKEESEITKEATSVEIFFVAEKNIKINGKVVIKKGSRLTGIELQNIVGADIEKYLADGSIIETKRNVNE